jgi:hypothetical protein
MKAETWKGIGAGVVVIVGMWAAVTTWKYYTEPTMAADPYDGTIAWRIERRPFINDKKTELRLMRLPSFELDRPVWAIRGEGGRWYPYFVEAPDGPAFDD